MDKNQLSKLLWIMYELAHTIEEEYEYGSIGQTTMSFIHSAARALREEIQNRGSE